MQKEYTAQAEKVLITAKSLARKWNHPYVGTEHLLLALKKEFTGVASQVLSMNGVEQEKIVKIIEELVAPVQDVKRRKIAFSPRLEFLLDNALQEAVRQRSERIGTEHLLLAMIKDADCVATRILVTLNVDLAKVQDDILETVGLNPKEYYEESDIGKLTFEGMVAFIDPITSATIHYLEEGVTISKGVVRNEEKVNYSEADRISEAVENLVYMQEYTHARTKCSYATAYILQNGVLNDTGIKFYKRLYNIGLLTGKTTVINKKQYIEVIIPKIIAPNDKKYAINSVIFPLRCIIFSYFVFET